MNNPIEELVNWLQSLPDEVELDICSMMAHMHPGIDADVMEQPATFYPKLLAICGQSLKGVASIIAFRGIFDFVYTRNRGTQASWDEMTKLHKDVVNEMKAQGKDFSLSERMLADMPERSKTWISIITDWNKLKSSALADAALDAWQIEGMRKSMTESRVPRTGNS